MTNHPNPNSAAQAAEPQTVLSFDERERILCQFMREPINHDREMAIAIETAVLSKLRAPADEQNVLCCDAVMDFRRSDAAFPAQPLPVFTAGKWTYDGTGQSFDYKDLDEAAFSVYRAALASAPVAGEAVTWEAVRQELAIFLMGATGRSSKEWHRPLDNASEGGALARMRACLAAPQASAEYERGHADGWAAGWDQAIKQPQADKDGGQQRAGDAVRDALWTLTEHNALHFGEQHSTVIQGRAALSTTQARQGERDA